MSTIWLKVEFAPGSDIARACRDAIALAERTGVSVHASFNGVLLMAAQGDDPEALERSWHAELAGKSSYKIATAHRGAKS